MTQGETQRGLLVGNTQRDLADLETVRLLEILATFEDYHMLDLRRYDVLVCSHQPLRSALDG
jgi:hypothetical protein